MRSCTSTVAFVILRGVRRALYVTTFALLTGCSSSDVPPPLGSKMPGSGALGDGMLAAPVMYTGAPGTPMPATIVEGDMLIDVTVDGVTGTVVIDTGSPVVALDLGPFAGAQLPDGSGSVPTFAVGDVTFSNAPVLGADLLMSGDPSTPLDGTMGCTILCNFAIALDYRDQTFTLGKSTMLPGNIESPGQSIAFALEGGGIGQLEGTTGDSVLPRSRIPVTVTIEGTSYPFMLDTGSGDTVISEAILTKVTADGRATMATEDEDIGGAASGTLTRLRSVVVGGAEVDGIIATEDSNINAALPAIGAEVGHEVDGLLGGSFLRQFYVTVDYPGGMLHLQRYTAGGPTFDELDSVGVAVGASDSSGGVTVGQVLAGTDASAKGVSVGDVILAVDGQSLASVGATAAQTAFSGVVGSTKMIQFGPAASPTLSMQTVAIAVDDLLPL
jgi:Aspartyl protease/PDZ domain